MTLFSALIISAAIAVTLLVVLVILRLTGAAAKPIRAPQAALIIVIVVAVAGAVDGYLVVRSKKQSPGGTPGSPLPGASAGGMRPGGGPGGGMGMMGGGMGGPGGGMGMMGGGQREPSPKRDLGQFVRKLALFQEKGEGALDAQQVAAVLPLLTRIQEAERMTEDEGKANLETLRAALTEAQRTAVDAVELPRPAGMGMMGGGMGPGGGPGGPGGGGPGMGPGGPGGGGPGMGPGGPGGGGPGMGPGGPGGGAPSADRTQQFRDRMLEIPFVKEQYDAKAAEDSTFATDQGKQREFFTAIMRELSPFRRGSNKDALDGLVMALQGGETGAAPAP